MDIKTKHRIIGVIVLVALAVIIIPLFFSRSQSSDKAAALSAKVPTPPQKQAVQLAIPAANSASSNSSELATQALQAGNSDQSAQQDQIAAQSEANDQAANEETNTPTTASTTAAAPATATESSASADTTAQTPNNNPDNSASTQAAAASASSSSINSEVNNQQSVSPDQVDESLSSDETLHEKAAPRTKTGAVKKALAEAKSKAHIAKKHHYTEKEKVKPAIAAHAWTIQLASFSQRINAQQLVKQLRAKGFTAYIHEARSERGEVSRVFVGPELKKERADLLLKKLHEAFGLKGVVVEYKV